MRTLLLVGALALAALTMPAAALAKPGYIRLPPSFSVQVELPRSDGYRLSAYGAAGQRLVYMTATRGAVSATYWRHGGAVSRQRIAADLGRFGRIEMRLGRLRATPTRRFPGCKGRPDVQLRGVARGTFAFRGLNDFASVESHRARVVVNRTFAQVCKRETGSGFFTVGVSSSRNRPRLAAPPKLHLRADVLVAQGSHDGAAVSLTATKLDFPQSPGEGPEADSTLDAMTTRQFGPVGVRNLAFGIDEGAELEITQGGRQPTAAIVRDSGLIEGESWFYRSRGGPPTWTGSLQVAMPGEGRVPLSGPGFRAELCRGPASKVFEDCQLSGSQSQSLFVTRLSWSR
jgi:hypothetical protein